MSSQAEFLSAHSGDTDTALAAALVRHAGTLAADMRARGLDTEYKTSISDVVTAADREAERFIATVLRELRPEDGLVGEEGAAAESDSGRTWVIDPVDGTYNFASGLDYWCSALALVTGRPDDPVALHLGAIYRPAEDALWVGGPHVPTTRNGAALPRLADSPAARLSCATYLHPTRIRTPERRDPWTRAVSRFATVRMLGSASVDLAGVAEGRLGCWFQHSVASWDWLPGRALVEGVGGSCQRVTAQGTQWYIAGPVAATAEVAEALGWDDDSEG